MFCLRGLPKVGSCPWTPLPNVDTLDSQWEWEQETLQKNSSGILRGRAISSSSDSHLEVVHKVQSAGSSIRPGLAFVPATLQGKSLSIWQSGHYSPADFDPRICKLSSFVYRWLKLRTQPAAVHYGNFLQWLLWSSKSVVEIILTM